MDEELETPRILTRFKSETGEVTGSLLDLPINITVDKLQLICNALLEQDENTPYVFFVNDNEIKGTLGSVIDGEKGGTEQVVDIVYQQQAVFKVRAVTRCTSSIPGHAEAVISVSFSPNGRHLASGSGDTTVRFWDVDTQTPHHTCKGHKNWVLCIAWSPNGARLASGCKSGEILIWDPDTGKQCGQALRGHRQWITSLCWEPFHRNPECRRLASSSKDGDIRIWDAVLGQSLFILTSHTKCVTCIRWGGSGLLYSSSQDRTIKGVMCRTLEGHAHWVNTLALSTDYVLRIGSCDPIQMNTSGKLSPSEVLERYNELHPSSEERLVSGSDDFTLFLWQPESSKKPIARMTGHQQLVNDVKFSPDTRIIASASFDKSIKLWDGRTGKFLAALRGHVQAVYQIAWSADSRLLVMWNMETKKIEVDLPGHADEVYAVDWSADGQRVASGGKDKVLKLWQN
ncbi:Protein Notchless [Gryllus bimaculatus]|nr:Protein Notchless [Gryllus bimaculatus]